MPFERKFASVYTAIREAVTAIDYECIRADEIHKSELIMGSVLENIQRARWVIADLTGRNANVFYELGIAHAWKESGRVILLARRTNDIPFDIKPFRCILYEARKLDDLKSNLILTIGTRPRVQPQRPTVPKSAAAATDTGASRGGIAPPNGDALILTARHEAELVRIARREAPNMACGVLAGVNNRVMKVYDLPNAERSQFRFSIDQTEVIRAYREIDGRGWDIVGIWSSRPHTDAYPAPSDIKLATWNDAMYVYVSIADPAAPTIRAFRIVNGHVDEKSIVVAPQRN